MAVGVLVWAVLHVLLMRRGRTPRPVRLPPSRDDPVSDALADTGPLPRLDDAGLDVTELRWIVSVAEIEPVDEGGWNTVVGLDDTVSSYADVAADGLEDALADQPGMDAVHHVDREVVLVRSVLSLPDVHAAAIRALLSIHRTPRPPRDLRLPPAVMNALADGVTAALAAHGFTGGPAPGGESTPSRHHTRGPLFHRVLADDGLVQTVELHHGFAPPDELTEGSLVLTVDVVEMATADAASSVGRCADPHVAVPGERVLSVSYDRVPATVAAIEQVLAGKALRLLESTRTRARIVDRWVSGLPWSVPDRLFWEAADVAARWGFRGHARDLLKHGPRRSPEAAAVAAKHGLHS
ncbi:hypothetical protein [Catellatospora citrea]|uniref:Uncharacterized protein n=1 Tax=Catellatospora citrea TaxID=53366 RepID=A0A8J3NX82_9ACTN|nr:hypothetical protein [Catellatospora citrea]RKE12705.1 hypothetical protein C8E86_7648 [Catellatospora citrea]GIF96057.1 hypothetical protein Cci01nite_11510 [Catellatospora citrea]